MPLTLKQLQSADWKQVYHYDYPGNGGACFKTFSSTIKGITVTHDRKVGSKRTIIYYTVGGRRTDSPAEAVRMWNAKEKADGAQTQK